MVCFSDFLSHFFSHKLSTTFLIFFFLLSLLSSLFLSSIFLSLSSSPKKHILLILADDQGLTDIGYADSQFSTPVLDSLAQNGTQQPHVVQQDLFY